MRRESTRSATPRCTSRARKARQSIPAPEP
jgi:hypothetical protein